jgi:thiamine-monophosphate kinase
MHPSPDPSETSPLQVRSVGEFGLIDRISKMLPCHSPEVVVGIGDDVAVLKTSGSDYLLATCDCQVESVHFLKDVITPFQLGRRVVAINVSDIASMGGQPTWALVSLVLPDDTEVNAIQSLYEGMRTEFQQYGGVIVGGNISRSPERFMIDFFLLGRVSPDRMVLRSGAQPGDVVLVTGTLGDSRAGRQCLLHPHMNIGQEFRDTLLARHLTPRPRLPEGQLLASTGWVHAMADISDGLGSDLRHICGASHVGARIVASKIPISPSCRKAADAAGMDPLAWALTGGEDYELVFTVPPDVADQIRHRLQEETGTSAHVVAEILDDPNRLEIVNPDGKVVAFRSAASGWDHFQSTGQP